MPEQPTPTPVAPPPEEPQRPDPLASAVAEAVGKLRRTAGLSERAAARRLGTSQTQLRRMEDPRYLPSLRSLAGSPPPTGTGCRARFGGKARPKKAPQSRRSGRRSQGPRHLREAGGPLRVVPVAAREGDGELLPHDDEADRHERF